MDVTQEILRNTKLYGASDYTAAHSLASSKSLNYAEGASIQKPIVERKLKKYVYGWCKGCNFYN